MRLLEKPTRWAAAVVVLLLALLLGMTGLALAQQPSGQAVVILEVRGVIDPVVAQYVKQGLETANHIDAQLLIICLDTPGGLDTAMREIVQAILNSEIPIAVFVEPSGARAASAGVFITMAADVAAMAPGTNIGAAHPLALGDQGEIIATLEDKLTNDAVAYLQAIAQQRGRNVAWAEEAVRQSASLTAQQALERQVVDIIANDLADLLTQLDGRKVTTRSGERMLELTAAPLETHPMTWLEVIAHGLVDPNIAYILLSLGTIALIAEFYNPGAVLPGVTGAICLILAFIALGNLPVNWGGMALIGLAFFLFILDLKVTGFALSVAGAISFVLGSLFLFSPFTPTSPTMSRLSVSPWLLVLMTFLLVGFFSFAVTAGLRAQRQKVLMSRRGLIGATGVALSDLAPQGVVQVQSETWTAVATESVKAGETVEVVDSDGLYLQVHRSN
ncbi:MAG: nodulation protein NfeD [Anaerolineales bacterium]|nr:nodulation protein NfeD [Anaerolineales bacterium]